jgi:hypothetical protein
MGNMLTRLAGLGALAAAAAASQDVLTIMERVAANQDRAQAERAAYVYHQQVQVRLHRGAQRLAREEIREYVALPGPKSTSKQLVAFSGKYERGGEYLYYSKPGFTYKEVDIDGELAGELGDEFSNGGNSRDSLASWLFPLNTSQMRKYRFTLEGRENYRGRDVYRIAFQPGGDAVWSGEVLVDAAELQPVLIATRQAKRVPVWARMVFGTNVRHLGFKVTYQRFGDGAWFPVSYGGEFELRALFAYRRKISIAVRNSGFRKADVRSDIEYDTRALVDR